METQSCFSCGNQLPERAFYCPNCATRVRCKNCRDILEPEAKACVTCGTLVSEGDKAQTSEGTRTSNLAANTIEYRETQKSRSLRATFTDTIGNGLNETLNSLITNRIGAGKVLLNKASAYNPNLEQQKQLPALTEISESSDEIIEVNVQNQEQISTKNITNADGLRKIFRFNDDNSLTLMDARLKAKSKLDFARRLTFLFLYAHDWAGRMQMKRTDLNAMLKQSDVYDENTIVFQKKIRAL